MEMEQCSETSAYKIQMPRNYSSQTFPRINTPTFSTPVILHTYPPMKMQQCSETSAYKIQTAGNFSSQTFSHINTLTFSTRHSSYLPAYGDGTECSETSAYKIQTPGNFSSQTFSHINTQHSEPQSFFIPTRLWRWNSVPKRRHIKFRRRGIIRAKPFPV